MDIRKKLVELLQHDNCPLFMVFGDKVDVLADYLIANGVKVQDAEQEKGEWNWKHRYRGGFRKYTGEDALGEKHTITVDERFECYDPYCPACGKLNESIYLNFCPNCGKAMLPSEPPFARRKPPKGE